MAHDIFISYSSKDKIYADAICASLEKSKCRCWIAPRDILPGENWGEAIVDAITDSRVMVIIFSANANASQQVMREVERAVFKNVPIIPFRIQDVKPTKSMEFFLSTPHWLDAIDDDQEKHFHELLETVDRILNHASQDKETTATLLSKEPSILPIKDPNLHTSNGNSKKKKSFIGIKAIIILLIIIITASVTRMVILDRAQDSGLGTERKVDDTVVEEIVETPSSEVNVDITTDTSESTSKDDSSGELDSGDTEETYATTENYADVAVLITTGNIYDSLIKSDIWAGLMNGSEYYDIESYLYETDYYTDYEAIEDALYYGSDIIILQGEELSGYVEVYAPNNPYVQFVLIDGVSDYQGSNFIQMNFIDNEAIFVAGYIASLETETDNVAFVGIDGLTDSKYNVLFENGVKYASDVEVYNLDVFDALEYIIYNDIDVVYNMAGEYGNYLIDIADEYGFYVIGDQSIYGSESINFLTSLIRDYYYAASEVVDYYMSYGPTGGSIIYNLEYDMVYFLKYSMSDSTEDTMYELIDDIVDGFIIVE